MWGEEKEYCSLKLEGQKKDRAISQRPPRTLPPAREGRISLGGAGVEINKFMSRKSLTIVNL